MVTGAEMCRNPTRVRWPLWSSLLLAGSLNLRAHVPHLRSVLPAVKWSVTILTGSEKTLWSVLASNAT